MNDLNEILTAIAHKHLRVSTLETRRSDSLDFHDLAVWKLRSALEAAFHSGAQSAPLSPPAAPGLPARFDDYEIHGVKRFDADPGPDAEPQGKAIARHEEQVDDFDAEYWSLFGHIPGQGLDCIGDYATREHAEEVFSITGRRYTDHVNKTKGG